MSYSTKTIKELKAICKERNLTGYSRLTKEKLLARIQLDDKKVQDVKPPEPPRVDMSEVEQLRLEIERLQLELQTMKMKTRVEYAVGTPLGILQTIGDTIYHNEHDSSMWKGSPLESLDKLKSDLSGKAGELLIEQFCKDGEIPHLYIGDSNSTDGTYDILIKDKKVEIKTAKLGKHKGFQHESLRMTGYDYLLFVDICPTSYYLTILPKFDLRTKSDILGRTPHLRKGASDVYKLDFNEKILQSLITKGHTIKILETTPLTEVTTFLQKMIE